MTTGCDTTKPTHARDPQPCSDDRDAARQLLPALDDFIAWLQQHCGIDFTGYKPGTLARRIQQRLLATGQTDLEAYRHYLETHADEREALNQCLLINVTEFFRDLGGEPERRQVFEIMVSRCEYVDQFSAV